MTFRQLQYSSLYQWCRQDQEAGYCYYVLFLTSYSV